MMMMMMMMMEPLLLMFLLTHTSGTQDIQTVSKISVQKQQTITIPCGYDQKYVAYTKYMCFGSQWAFCSTVSHKRLSVVDNQTENVFTATLREAEVSDSGWYWCAIRVSGSDPGTHLYLQVTEVKAKLCVSSQSVSGYEGGNVTVRCDGASDWCRFRGSCVGRDGRERTTVSDDGDALRVTLWQLQREDSGWYYCSDHSSQMPVHLTVMEALITTQFTTDLFYTPTPPAADRPDSRRLLLWLLPLGAMLPVTVCGAGMLIRARNKRKQSTETSNLHEDKNKQQLPKDTGRNTEVACGNLYQFTTGSKSNAQGNGKIEEVACEDLYETMTGGKSNTRLENDVVAYEDVYEVMNGFKDSSL